MRQINLPLNDQDFQSGTHTNRGINIILRIVQTRYDTIPNEKANFLEASSL